MFVFFALCGGGGGGGGSRSGSGVGGDDGGGDGDGGGGGSYIVHSFIYLLIQVKYIHRCTLDHQVNGNIHLFPPTYTYTHTIVSCVCVCVCVCVCLLGFSFSVCLQPNKPSQCLTFLCVLSFFLSFFFSSY